MSIEFPEYPASGYELFPSLIDAPAKKPNPCSTLAKIASRVAISFLLIAAAVGVSAAPLSNYAIFPLSVFFETCGCAVGSTAVPLTAKKVKLVLKVLVVCVAVAALSSIQFESGKGGPVGIFLTFLAVIIGNFMIIKRNSDMALFQSDNLSAEDLAILRNAGVEGS